MAYVDFSIDGRGNFTVSDTVIQNRTEANTMGWEFDDWETVYNRGNGLTDEVLVGSPSASTISHWFSQAGLYLYTR